MSLQELFLGQFSVKLTDKNRIVIPVKFREQLAPDSTFLVSAYNQFYLELLPKNTLEAFRKQLNSLSRLHRDLKDFKRQFFATTELVKLDDQGRFIIPTPLITNLGSQGKDLKNLIIIGVGDSLELWDESRWQIKSDNLTQSTDSLSERLAYLIDSTRNVQNN